MRSPVGLLFIPGRSFFFNLRFFLDWIGYLFNYSPRL